MIEFGKQDLDALAFELMRQSAGNKAGKTAWTHPLADENFCLQIAASSDLESVWLSKYSRQRAALGFIGRRWLRWSRAAMSR